MVSGVTGHIDRVLRVSVCQLVCGLPCLATLMYEVPRLDYLSLPGHAYFIQLIVFLPLRHFLSWWSSHPGPGGSFDDVDDASF